MPYPRLEESNVKSTKGSLNTPEACRNAGLKAQNERAQMGMKNLATERLGERDTKETAKPQELGSQARALPEAIHEGT